jgi:hypothetical protein
MFIRPDGERQPPVFSSHHFLKEPFCRGNISSRTQHEFGGRPSLSAAPYKYFQLLPTFT